MGGFQTPSAGGITKLSQLQIDADKNWNGKAISNLPDGVLPQDPVTFAQLLSYVTSRFIKLPLLPITIIPTISSITEVTSGALSDTTSVLPIDTIPTLVVPDVVASPPLPVDGFVSHVQSPPVDTDETTESNEGTIDDMDLLPVALTAAGDGCYFGLDTAFDWITVKVSTAGLGTYTVAWKYWNGTQFTTIPYINFNTIGNFKISGIQTLSFKRPVDWDGTLAIAGITAFWIKAEADGGNMTQQPKGTQAYIGQY